MDKFILKDGFYYETKDSKFWYAEAQSYEKGRADTLNDVLKEVEGVPINRCVCEWCEGCRYIIKKITAFQTNHRPEETDVKFHFGSEIKGSERIEMSRTQDTQSQQKSEENPESTLQASRTADNNKEENNEIL